MLLYAGRPDRTVFMRRRLVAEATLEGELAYEELPEIWDWKRIKEAHLRGAFAEEVVDRARLLEILLHHLDAIEDDLRPQVTQAVDVVSKPSPPPLVSTMAAAWASVPTNMPPSFCAENAS